MGGSTLIIFLCIVGEYPNGARALLDSYFQVSSIMTTEILSDIFNIEPQLIQAPGQEYPILLTYDLKK